MDKKKPGRRHKGFSLIELMFGISILLIVIVGTLSAYVNCILLNQANRNLVTATNDAQYALEQVKAAAENFSSIPAFIASYPANQFSNLPDETITFPNPVYTSTLDTITVRISWKERNATKSISISSCFAQ